MSSRPPEGLRTLSDPVPGATRVVLVRHGQGQVNAEGRIGGPLGCTGLTQLGVSQVNALANRLTHTKELNGAHALYSSILPRARQTAEILAGSLAMASDDIVEDCELCELHSGQADGLIWEEYIERFGAPDWDSDPNRPIAPSGESWITFVNRASDGVESIAKQHPGQLVVIVTHAGVIESTLLRWLVAREREFSGTRLRLRTKHASLTEWEYADSNWKLLRFNDAAHENALALTEETL